MNGEEKRKWYELKDKAGGELEKIVSAAMSGKAKKNKAAGLQDSDVKAVLDNTDKRIWKYIEGVGTDIDGHNLYEILGVLRFFRLMKRYRWNARRVQKFFKFYEILKFDGNGGRCRYKLTPVQCFQFGSIFGFMDDNGRRLCRTAYLFVPRKFGKTTSVASLAVWDLFFGDNNAEAYVGANSYRQAKVCFDEIRNIVKCIDPQGRHFKVNREIIQWLGMGHDSLVECLAANAKTRDGLKASTVIIDEYAQARNTATKSGADLKNVLTSSMGTRKEPLTVVITTASEVVDGPFAHELDGVKKVLRGEIEDDRMFASLFMPDPDDEDGDPHTWRKVQPHIGITVQPDYYENEWKTAQLSAENMLNFRTKMLNIFTINSAKTWFDYEQATALTGDFDIDQLPRVKASERMDCAVAFDLSVHDDFSAVTYTVWSKEMKKFRSFTDYYFPEGALSGHPNEELYRRWHADGWLQFCNGDRIDVRMIAGDILRRSRLVRIIRIGYDGYKARDLVNILSSAGLRGVLQPYSQTYGSFNLPVEAFEMMAYADPPGIEINRNPINVYCLCNCVIDEDRLENKKPIKIAQTRKIDGAVTLLMTIGIMGSYER